MPFRGQSPVVDVVPVAPDQLRLARVTPGAGAFGIADVARVHVTEAMAQRDLSCPLEGREWRRGYVAHFPVRMERREVQRHLAAEVPDEPVTHRLELGIGVVESGDEQCRNL